MSVKVCIKLEIRLGKSEINSIFARYKDRSFFNRLHKVLVEYLQNN